MIVAAIFVFCSCSPDDLDASSVPSESIPTQEQSDRFAEERGLKMYMAQTEYPMGTEVVVAYIENPTENEAGYGADWFLERYDEILGFQPVQPKEPIAFVDIWYILYPNKTSTFTVNLTYYGENIQPGRYRVTATSVAMDSVGGGTLYAEFSIR